ncbi:hypothetical protein ACJ6WD_38350 [Streptomyces sp. VTCC 41912]|uniref:hypothetical protein n=1 Tax=Streptomyces sp. VTCC 41912 TaxID=3383243 RepID=UPI0038969CC2
MTSTSTTLRRLRLALGATAAAVVLTACTSGPTTSASGTDKASDEIASLASSSAEGGADGSNKKLKPGTKEYDDANSNHHRKRYDCQRNKAESLGIELVDDGNGGLTPKTDEHFGMKSDGTYLNDFSKRYIEGVIQACDKEFPIPKELEDSSQEKEEQLKKSQKIAACMRKEGIDVKDPTLNDPTVALDPDDPRSEAAHAKCEKG